LAKQTRAKESIGERLKGNIMIGRKANLQRFENVTVSIMKEFYLDASNPVDESPQVLDEIGSIVEMARKRWVQP
jgi:hypothetical protein